MQIIYEQVLENATASKNINSTNIKFQFRLCVSSSQAQTVDFIYKLIHL